jgi:hypothetical protein
VRNTAHGAILLLMLVALFGCSAHHAGKYRDAVAANRIGIAKLRFGMTESEVRSLMGNGEMVQYRKINLVNPWRSEAFLLADGTPVRILLYVTEQQRRYRTAEDHELTPIVFEGDQLVGWGWVYIERNTDRYRVSAPPEQR